MYEVITLEDKVRVPPQYFSMKLEDAVTHILREKYERRIDKDLGIILSIWNAKPEGEGVVIPGDGAAHYTVTFDLLSYLPEINEVLEAEVTELVEFGAFLSLGPLEGLVHLSQIANDYLTYNKKIPAFVGKQSKKSLKKNEVVYAKISTVSLKRTIQDTKIGLTMRPDGLGKLAWIEAAERKRKAPAEDSDKGGERGKQKPASEGKAAKGGRKK